MSETLGLRISIEGLRLYGTHTNRTLQSEPDNRQSSDSEKKRYRKFLVFFFMKDFFNFDALKIKQKRIKTAISSMLSPYAQIIEIASVKIKSTSKTKMSVS